MTNLNALLRQYTYKPGWRFVTPWTGTAGVVLIGLECHNPTDPVTGGRSRFSDGSAMALWFPKFVHWDGSVEELERNLGMVVAHAEHHEQREFLRRDGECVFVAHGDDGTVCDSPLPAPKWLSDPDKVALVERSAAQLRTLGADIGS